MYINITGEKNPNLRLISRKKELKNVNKPEFQLKFVVESVASCHSLLQGSWMR